MFESGAKIVNAARFFEAIRMLNVTLLSRITPDHGGAG
jgi:hypothetical protein